jgi:hypothetical protein
MEVSVIEMEERNEERELEGRSSRDQKEDKRNGTDRIGRVQAVNEIPYRMLF